MLLVLATVAPLPPVRAQAGVPDAVSCLAQRIISRLPDPGSVSGTIPTLRVLPCRNMAGFDAHALQQLLQLLQSEILRQGSGRLEIASEMATVDVESATPQSESGTVARADYWLEPLAGYSGNELVIGARLFARDNVLTDFVVCTAGTNAAEIALFSQPPPVMQGLALKELFRSQPLPFSALDFCVREGAEGPVELSFVDSSRVWLFEMRDTTLLMRGDLALPPAGMQVRDTRASIWQGDLAGSRYLLAQRSSEQAIHAFVRSEDGVWQIAAVPPLDVVPFAGSHEALLAGGRWEMGRNYLDPRTLRWPMPQDQTQPDTPPRSASEPDLEWGEQAELYAADIAGGGSPQVVGVTRDSRLAVLQPERMHRTAQGSGDAVCVLPGTEIAVTSLPVVGAAADGLRGVRIGAGVVVFEMQLPGGIVLALRAQGSRLYALTRDPEGRHFLHVYQIDIS